MNAVTLTALATVIAAIASLIAAIGGILNHGKLGGVKEQIKAVKSDTQIIKNGTTNGDHP